MNYQNHIRGGQIIHIHTHNKQKETNIFWPWPNKKIAIFPIQFYSQQHKSIYTKQTFTKNSKLDMIVIRSITKSVLLLLWSSVSNKLLLDDNNNNNDNNMRQVFIMATGFIRQSVYHTHMNAASRWYSNWILHIEWNVVLLW